MTVKRRGLGRNLDALLGATRSAAVHHAVSTAPNTTGAPEPSQIPSPSGARLHYLPIDMIAPGQYQPRSVFDEDQLKELAQSIASQGVISPITVRQKAGSTDYEIIAGERRWRAAQLANLKHIPALIKDLSDEDALAIGLIENIQREDLNPMEEAIALRRLLDEFDLTHQQVADAVGKSRSAVSNLLRLMELSAPVKQLLACGDIEMGHARALLALSGEPIQTRAAKQVVNNRLTVRQTEQLVKRLLNPKKAAVETTVDVNVQRFVQDMSEKLGAKVTIEQSSPKKGKLVIHYHCLDELEGIVERIK